MNNRNRTALITGGSTGIGAACALRLAEDGYRVLITGRDEKTLKQSASRHDNIDYLVADVTKLRDVTLLANETEKRLGPLALLVNNAGVAPRLSFEQTTLEDTEKVFNTNVRGVFAVSQECLSLLKQAKGCIVNISSVVGERPNPSMFIYSASKAAIDNMTRAMARELIAYDIRVNAVSPGPIETPIFDKMEMSEEEQQQMTEQIRTMVPMARFGQAEEVAHVVAFLASDKAAYITGVNYPVDGGMLA